MKYEENVKLLLEREIFIVTSPTPAERTKKIATLCATDFYTEMYQKIINLRKTRGMWGVEDLVTAVAATNTPAFYELSSDVQQSLINEINHIITIALEYRDDNKLLSRAIEAASRRVEQHNERNKDSKHMLKGVGFEGLTLAQKNAKERRDATDVARRKASQDNEAEKQLAREIADQRTYERVVAKAAKMKAAADKRKASRETQNSNPTEPSIPAYRPDERKLDRESSLHEIIHALNEKRPIIVTVYESFRNELSNILSSTDISFKNETTGIFIRLIRDIIMKLLKSLNTHQTNQQLIDDIHSNLRQLCKNVMETSDTSTFDTDTQEKAKVICELLMSSTLVELLNQGWSQI